MLYLEIFTRDYVEKTPITSIRLPSDIYYLRRVYTFNKDAIINYYKKRNFATKNTHLLSRLLEHFPLYLNYDDYRYLSFAKNRLTYLAKHFRLTNELEYGIVHKPYFFGNNGEEIIFALDEYFPVNEFSKNWENEPVLTVLRHHKNDLKILLPLGNDDGSKSGLCSIGVNIPKLALKYRYFYKNQIANVDNNGTFLNKNHFLMKYVLNTVIGDIIDHMLLNRVMDTFYNNPIVTPKYKYRFKIFEPEKQVNRYVEETLDTITSKNLDFINILHNIQLIFKIDASELLILPDIGYTRQVKWAIFLSRLDYMKFLYDVSKNKDMNRHYINDWKRLVTRMKRDSGFKDLLSTEEKKKVEEIMYEISNY